MVVSLNHQPGNGLLLCCCCCCRCCCSVAVVVYVSDAIAVAVAVGEMWTLILAIACSAANHWKTDQPSTKQKLALLLTT